MKRKTTKTAPAAEPVAVATQSANVAPEEGDLAEGDPSKKGTAASKKAAKPTAKPATKAGWGKAAIKEAALLGLAAK